MSAQGDLFSADTARARPLTILSYGGGQDSTAILDRLGAELDAVVFSDTGNEHPHTYRTIERARDYCAELSIPFFWLHPESRYHSEAWGTLTNQWDRNATIGMARGKGCSDNLKIKPIYRWLNDYCAELLGIPAAERQDHGKPAIRQWAAMNGRIRMIIGIAKGEESRLGKDDGLPAWMRESVERAYPLIAWGWDRKACQTQIERHSERWGKVWPSNCMFCHFQSPQELLWLAKRYPAEFERWKGYEARKIAANTHKPKNHGVYGAKLLAVKLLDAERKHGSLTDAELDEYKYSHGHTGTHY